MWPDESLHNNESLSRAHTHTNAGSALGVGAKQCHLWFVSHPSVREYPRSPTHTHQFRVVG